MIIRIFTFFRMLSITLLLLMSVEMAAQPNIPGDPGDDPDVPITGIEILIGAGAIWGAKKYADSRKQRK